jgi:tetratricopeptide (TPR) repeat protein
MLAAAGSGRFRLSPSKDPRDLGLDSEELALAECFRAAPREVSEVTRVSTLGPRRTEVILYGLLVTGHLVRAAATRAPESGVRAKVVPVVPAPWDPSAAAKTFERAYAAMQAGKLEAAEVMCREALDDDPQDMNHAAMRVWLRALRPEGQSELATRRAIVDLSRIIERHDECAHAHFFRGQLFKRIGRPERAASDFRSTLEHDPKRMDALAELRLYVSRRRREA